MAVPKKKQSKQRTRVSHTAWTTKQQKKLLNSVNIVTCLQCSARIPERTLCPECGFYKGEQRKSVSASSNINVVKA
jgi:ribosomal protein L32